ncbi:hypothetical protein HPB51_027098 [Rhipicephalus microplus]|uniref:Uncharacterized protein n=1 Tax=Rhipicephalus microplus TaxID=6941 RepID=A0A9J6D0T4_RHIMP|nr:hypothetical protein HPB51_027098 [Rhipicephalus microplus]
MAKTLFALTRTHAASHARLKATKTPLKKTLRSKTDLKAEPDMSALDQVEESVAGVDITHQDNEGTYGTSGGKERHDNGGGQMVLTVYKKKTLAKAGKKLTTTEGDYDIMSPTSKSLSQPTSQRRPQKRTLPPLPKEDFIRRTTIPRTTYKRTNGTTNCRSSCKRLSRYYKRQPIFAPAAARIPHIHHLHSQPERGRYH